MRKNNCLTLWKTRIDWHIKRGETPNIIWKKLRKLVKRSGVLPTKKVRKLIFNFLNYFKYFKYINYFFLSK